jgi:hypothetical protein
MKFRKLSLAVVCLIGCFSLTAESSRAGLNQSDFETLRESLKPDTSESWRQIPWRISLLEGQRVAAAEGKPIFIWAMDGHPLGCT